MSTSSLRIDILTLGFPAASETFVREHARRLGVSGHRTRVIPRLTRQGEVVDREYDVLPSRFGEGRKLDALLETPGVLARALLAPRAIPAVSRWRQRGLASTLVDLDWALRFGVGDRDVVHAHFGPAIQFALDQRYRRRLAFPVVGTFHGWDVNVLARVDPHRYRHVFDECELLTAGSRFMAERVVALGADPERLIVLPWGVDVAEFEQIDRSARPEEPTVVVTVARQIEAKAIDVGLRAVAEVVACGRSVRLLVVGDGPLRSELARLAADLGLGGLVQFLGAIDPVGVRRCLAEADIYLATGREAPDGAVEGQGVALLEAMATGLPPVVSAVGGQAEAIEDGASGLLVPADDVQATAHALLALVDDPQRCWRLGASARRAVEERFDQARLVPQLVERYRTLVGECAGPPLETTNVEDSPS